MRLAASVAACTATFAVSAVANAEFYTFVYSGATVHATGVIEVLNGVATSGSVTVSNSLNMDGVYTLLSVNGLSPSGMFQVDSAVMLESNPLLTNGGILFSGEQGEINIWGNAPENYSLWRAADGGYSSDDGGNFAMVIPTPGALALLGLAGIVGARRRRA